MSNKTSVQACSSTEAVWWQTEEIDLYILEKDLTYKTVCQKKR